MSETALEKTARRLNERLEEEKTAHAKTRNELRVTIERVWRLVPQHYINLMGVYPALRRLLHVLAEAADLQDPTRGAAIEDTMRTEVTELTPTERGVISHHRQRANVRTLQKDIDKLANRIHRILDDRTHHMGSLIPGSEWEYDPPDGECEECGNPVMQPAKGRPRKYCLTCSPAKERAG